MLSIIRQEKEDRGLVAVLRKGVTCRILKGKYWGTFTCLVVKKKKKKNQKVKQKQYCNKFNKDFKNSPHQKHVKKDQYKINKNKRWPLASWNACPIKETDKKPQEVKQECSDCGQPARDRGTQHWWADSQWRGGKPHVNGQDRKGISDRVDGTPRSKTMKDHAYQQPYKWPGRWERRLEV